jgi:hypothetical protein
MLDFNGNLGNIVHLHVIDKISRRPKWIYRRRIGCQKAVG